MSIFVRKSRATAIISTFIEPECVISNANIDVLVNFDRRPDSNSIVYTITSPFTKGLLRKQGVNIGLGNSFTQADLENGYITYRNTVGSEGSDFLGVTINIESGSFTTNEVIEVKIAYLITKGQLISMYNDYFIVPLTDSIKWSLESPGPVPTGILGTGVFTSPTESDIPSGIINAITVMGVFSNHIQAANRVRDVVIGGQTGLTACNNSYIQMVPADLYTLLKTGDVITRTVWEMFLNHAVNTIWVSANNTINL